MHFLFPDRKARAGDVTTTIIVPRAALGALAAGDLGVARAAGLTLDGEAAAVQQFLGLLQRGNPAFNIVEP